MNTLLKSVTVFAAAGIFLVSTIRADEWNKRTVVTIDQPIEVPNQVLAPGTYVFKLLNSPSNRHIVQIYDKNEQHLITTTLAIPNYRLQPTGKTEMSFWETPAGTPSALRAWFYPGDNFGQEFAYPPKQASKIAAYAQQPVVTTTATPDQYASAAVTSTPPPPPPAPAREAQPAPQTQPPPPPPTPRAVTHSPSTNAQAQREPAPPAAAPNPTPAPVQPPAELPHTASSTPLIGLIGLFALVGAGAMFAAPLRSRR